MILVRSSMFCYLWREGGREERRDVKRRTYIQYIYMERERENELDLHIIPLARRAFLSIQ